MSHDIRLFYYREVKSFLSLTVYFRYEAKALVVSEVHLNITGLIEMYEFRKISMVFNQNRDWTRAQPWGREKGAKDQNKGAADRPETLGLHLPRPFHKVRIIPAYTLPNALPCVLSEEELLHCSLRE